MKTFNHFREKGHKFLNFKTNISPFSSFLASLIVLFCSHSTIENFQNYQIIA